MLDRQGITKWTSLKERNNNYLKYIEDLSHKEIAKTLDKSEGAIRLIQHRAIKSLKELYTKSALQKRTYE